MPYQITFMLPLADNGRNGQNHKQIIIFEPMISTPIKYDKAQQWYIMVTWAGVVLHRVANSRSWQGHFKVTARSNQPKLGKIAYFGSFCSNYVHLTHLQWF